MDEYQDPSEARYAAYVAQLTEEFPGFSILRKDQSRLHRGIDRFLRIVTFGNMTSYLDSFQTTIRRTVYVTPDWDTTNPDQRYVTLRHEAVHLAQFRRFTLPGMALLYVLLPLPMGLAWGRAYFEKQAYAESVRAAAEVWGPDYPRSAAYRAYILEQFTSASYGWMWPFPKALNRWYDRVLSSL